MTVAAEILSIFGWRDRNPNIADRSSSTSVTIASLMFEQLGITRESNVPGQTLGSRFETAINGVLTRRLLQLDQDRHWLIGSHPITEFSQYAHLDHIRKLAEEDTRGTLRSSLGTDYLIKPDITIGVLHDERQRQRQSESVSVRTIGLSGNRMPGSRYLIRVHLRTCRTRAIRGHKSAMTRI